VEVQQATATFSPTAPVARRRPGVWQRFRRHRVALVGALILLVLAAGAVGAPVVAANDPYKVDISAYRTGPAVNHPLGTDSSGRDVFSRLLYAGRVSLSVGLVAVAIYTLIGVILGAFSGFYGGWLDACIMRLADVVLSFPSLILIITVVSVLGPSIYNVMLVIGLLGWPPIARIVRALPTPSWGNMLKDAQSLTVLESLPWLWIPPGTMIALAVLSINFIGDGLRDALDPYLVH
jgi:peptide/nickel transport system permease protein